MNNSHLLDDLAQCQREYRAAVVAMQTVTELKEKTSLQYRLTFLKAKIEKLYEFTS